jgi:hypothetical protein
VRIKPGGDPYTRIHHFRVFRHLHSSGNKLIERKESPGRSGGWYSRDSNGTTAAEQDGM